MAASIGFALVVTGASSGIGRATVEKAVREGARVFASVRTETDAGSLTRELGPSVTPLLFDVTNEPAVRDAAGRVARELGDRRLQGLVNNAGIAVPGPLLHLETAELGRQLEVNLLGVHNVTRAFAPLLGTDPAREGPTGRVVMISSVSGENGPPFMGPYAASKFALEGYSQSLRRELLLHGIDVVVVGPGAIATPIWDKAEQNDVRRFADTPYAAALERFGSYVLKLGRGGLPAADVGDLVWHCLTAPNPKARYAILRRPFRDRTLPRLLGTRRLDRLIAKRIGFPPRR